MTKTIKTITRDEAVGMLIDDSIDAGLQTPAYLVDIFRDGFKGYANYSIEELHDAILPGIDEDILEILAD